MFLPTSQLRCHQLTLLLTNRHSSSIWHKIPDKCTALRGDSFSSRNCHKCLFVPNCCKFPLSLGVQSPFPLTKLRNKEEEPPSNGDSLQMKVKVTKSLRKSFRGKGCPEVLGKHPLTSSRGQCSIHGVMLFCAGH